MYTRYRTKEGIKSCQKTYEEWTLTRGWLVVVARSRKCGSLHSAPYKQSLLILLFPILISVAVSVSVLLFGIQRSTISHVFLEQPTKVAKRQYARGSRQLPNSSMCSCGSADAIMGHPCTRAQAILFPYGRIKLVAWLSSTLWNWSDFVFSEFSSAVSPIAHRFLYHCAYKIGCERPVCSCMVMSVLVNAN